MTISSQPTRVLAPMPYPAAGFGRSHLGGSATTLFYSEQDAVRSRRAMHALYGSYIQPGEVGAFCFTTAVNVNGAYLQQLTMVLSQGALVFASHGEVGGSSTTRAQLSADIWVPSTGAYVEVGIWISATAEVFGTFSARRIA